jgi:hypothetical protein
LIAISITVQNLGWLKTLASAVLAVLLWWLVLLGINVHVH